MSSLRWLTCSGTSRHDARMTQFNEDLRDARKVKFLEAYAKCGVIQPAITAAGISRSCYKTWRKNDEDFDQACGDAYEAAVDAAEVELRKRGVEGYDEPVLYKGEVIWQRHPDTGALLLDDDFNPIPFTRPVKSDHLLEVYTRSHRQRYKQSVQITGAEGGPIEQDFTVTFVMPDGKKAKDYPEGATPKMDHKTEEPAEVNPLDD